MVSAQERQQLKSYMSRYQNQQAATQDATRALLHFKDLHPKQKPYQNQTYAALEGTIPIYHKEQKYNIPIVLYILPTHPNQAPIAYVQPTSAMTVKASENVEPSGRIVVPYLREWNRNCEITSLLETLTVVFNDASPVFSKPKQSVNPPPSYPPQSSSNSQPYPPYPTGGSGGMPQPYPPVPSNNPYSSTGNPPYPPAGNPPYPAGNPPYPTTGYTPSSGYNAGGYPPYPTSGGPSGYGAPSSYPPTTAANFSYPGAQGAPYSPYPSYTNPAEQPVSATTVSASSSQKPVTNGYQLSDDQIKLSLRTAVEDKMRRVLRDMLATHKAEMDVLRNTQDNLMSGQEKLEKFEKSLNDELTECGRNISMLESKISELKVELEKRSQNEDVPPENSIDTTAPLYRQLLNAYAEEQAIEDTLYILGDSLRREVIGIETYLKKVRDLSRRQFMLRALIQKCRERAGLSDIYN